MRSELTPLFLVGESFMFPNYNIYQKVVYNIDELRDCKCKEESLSRIYLNHIIHLEAHFE